MFEWERKKILILVKTYPSPSSKYQEVVCTAGITNQGDFIRIYPIKYRYLGKGQQFEKFRWIEAEVRKNPEDQRPESYKINYDSIRLLEKIDSKMGAERLKWVLPLVSGSMEEIRSANEHDGITLGIFQPLEVADLVVSQSENPNWTEKEYNTLNQLSLGDSDVIPLEKIPYDFTFKYKCNNPSCAGHSMKITDWEICQTYRNFRRLYGEEKGIKYLKEKYMDFFTDSKTNTYFVVGTVHRWKTFIIIGVINIRNSSLQFPEQLSLF